MLQILKKYHVVVDVCRELVLRVRDYFWIDDVPTIFDSPLPVILMFLDTFDI